PRIPVSVSPLPADGIASAGTGLSSTDGTSLNRPASIPASPRRVPRGGDRVPYSPAAKPFKLVVASSPEKHRPSHILLHAVQGWVKSSLAAMAPAPIFIMTKNETGLITLIENRQIPPTPWIRFPRPNDTFSDEAETWSEALAVLRALLTEEHPYKTLILDTMN